MTDAARKMEKVFKSHALYPRSHPGHLTDPGSQDMDCSLCFRVGPLLALRVTTLTEIEPTVGSEVEPAPLGQYTRPDERHKKPRHESGSHCLCKDRSEQSNNRSQRSNTIERQEQVESPALPHIG